MHQLCHYHCFSIQNLILFFRNQLQGFESPGVVIITELLTATHNNELISRCMSNLIIVTTDSLFVNRVEGNPQVLCIEVQGHFKLFL